MKAFMGIRACDGSKGLKAETDAAPTTVNIVGLHNACVSRRTENGCWVDSRGASLGRLLYLPSFTLLL